MLKLKHTLRGTIFLGVLLLAGACSTDMPETTEEPVQEEEEKRYDFLRKEEHQVSESPAETMKDETVKNTAHPESVLTGEQIQKLESGKKHAPKLPVIVNPEKKDSAPAAPHTVKAVEQEPFYEEFILFDADEKIPVSIVFNSAPIQDVIPAFADTLGFNFMADSDLKGTVTLNLNSTLTKREIWHTFDSMLSLAGAAVRVDGSLLRILPASKLAQQPDLALKTGTAGEICYYTLKNTTAKNIVSQLKSFLSKDAAVVELTRPNAILVSDSPGNIAKARQILELLDQNGRNEWPRAIITCNNILPSKITTELKELLPVLGFYVQDNDSKTEQPGSVQLTALDRLQIIIASAATEEAIAELRNWVNILDSAQSMDQENVFIYKVRHGKADELLQALSMIYNVQGQSRTVDTDTGNNKTQNFNSSSNSSRRSSSRTSSSSNQARANQNLNNVTNIDTDQDSNLFDNQVMAYADGVLNRLVIRTTPRTYASIKAVLDRLDVVPAQVLLQVLIVEVTLDKSTEFGLEFSQAGTSGDNKFVIGNSSSSLQPFVTDSTTGEVTPNAENGFHSLFYDKDNPEQKYGYLKALAKHDNLKVISSPQLLVSSHTEAEIWVGQKVPYTQSAMTDTASVSQTSTAYVSSITFQETGTRLTITPQVTSTDYISLEVEQELSDVDDNSYTKVDAPVFTYRTVKTDMTIQNGKTMVIGGLIVETKSDDLESVPLIDTIPIVNRLFGNTNAKAVRSEILILITGTIVSEKSEVEDMIKRYNDAIKALNNFDNRLGDRPGKDQPFYSFGKEDVLK